MEYLVVRQFGHEALAQEVNKKIEEGYKLYGDLQVLHDGSGLQLYQALTKIERPNAPDDKFEI